MLLSCHSGMASVLRFASWFLAAAILAAAPQTSLPIGQIVERVVCLDDASQSYALFIPPGYTHDRQWPVIFGFDPGGRGRTPVDRYQAAATRYGYIVAGSNNSRNGSPDTVHAVSAMTRDVMSRFNVDPRRVYLAGMSGGARVALATALTAPGIAGVIASSAGYPDSQPRKTVPFALFATAGTEDFNHIEMRQLDRALTTPHHLAIFAGGHTWLSSALALEAVQWMEIQAMKSGLQPRDARKVEEILAARVADIPSSATDAAAYLALRAIATDFEELADVSAFAARAEQLGKTSAVRSALKRDRDEDDRELSILQDAYAAQARLSTDDRLVALAELNATWGDLSKKANAGTDSSERRIARRVLTGLAAGALPQDPEYLAIVARYRWRATPRAPQ